MRLATGCALTLVILLSPACHTTRLVRMDEAIQSPRVSLTLNDQSVVVVDGPKIYGDKLVGWVHGVYQEIPTAKVKEAHVRETNGARTAALVVAGALGFAGFAYAITGAGKSNQPDYCDAPEHVDEPICQTM
jgi:hypothetical protein